MRAASATLAFLSILITATWFLRRQESIARSEAIGQARAYRVANLTWARVDNWAKDLERGPCDWVAYREIPIVGTQTIECIIGGKPLVSFKYAMFSGAIEPADRRSAAQLKVMERWALDRGSYP